MIEYTYYKSGDWKVACTACQAEEIVQSLADAYRIAHQHRKRGCQ